MALVQFGTNSNARKKRVYYEGSDTLYTGMALCYNQDTTDNILGYNSSTGAESDTTPEGSQNEGKFLRVEKPSTANMKFFAGVVSPGGYEGKSGPRWINIYIPNNAIVPVRCTDSVTVGDKLYIVNADYEFTNVPTDAGFAAIVMETVDRSVTEGIALAKLVGTLADEAPVNAPDSKTASYTITAADNGKVFTNLGATGAVTFSLPSAPSAGLVYTFIVVANQNLAVDPGTSDKLLFGNDADVMADGEALTMTPADANDIGMNITLISDANGDWAVKSAWAPAATKFVIP